MTAQAPSHDLADPLLSVPEIASITGISPALIRKALHATAAGKGWLPPLDPAFRMGTVAGKFRVRLSEVERWVAAMELQQAV